MNYDSRKTITGGSLRCLLIILILLQISSIIAAVYTVDADSLTQKLDALLRSPLISGATVALGIWELEAGKEVFVRNADANLIPASLQKLYTLSAALHEMGSGHQFVTRFGYRGEIVEQCLNGDLVIIADGDPAWTTDFYLEGAHRIFEHWADSLSTHGIKSINGNVVINVGKFPVYRDSTTWDRGDYAYGYAAISAPFSFNENAIIYEITAGDTMDCETTISVEGGYSYLRFDNIVKTSMQGVKADVSINATDTPNHILISGTIPLESTYRVRAAVPDPHAFASGVMMQYFKEKGIEISGHASFDSAFPANAQMETLFNHPSPPLKDIVGVCMKRSSNLMGEMLYVQLSGGIASTQDKIRSFAATTGVVSNSLSAVDGCGLSRKNLLKASYLGKLLVFAQKQPWFKDFFSSLAISGTDGTLKTRLVESPAREKVFAKTGSMRGISNIAGYFTASDGKLYAFVILCNDVPDTTKARQWQDETLEEMVRLCEQGVNIRGSEIIQAPR
ncbi:MAG: D-alanyl-D-alanine carboxypeptidase/D-alanyl-D-alanine-endopeptidase [Candidatus Cloacimonadaceae bacterium]|nr:D-alanyl-D-alanine carboxypeptidase/D-alanyl-D-alanine-endopeptidase [Candidatus Cloacimonadaceae bacterium]